MRAKLITSCLAAFTSAGAFNFNAAPHATTNAPRATAVAARAAPSATTPTLEHGRPARGRPLWPGARFTDEERERAIERGLRFVYRSARVRANFDEYGEDYVWWFGALSNTVGDERVRRLARGMALECARRWRRTHHTLPRRADADTIADFVSGGDAAESVGFRDERLKEQLRRAAVRFSARDYLAFDPLTEPPPSDVPEECEHDGEENPRGTKFCRVCHRRLKMKSPLDVWYDALVTTQTGEHYGVTLGARYADVLKWLPVLRPYRVAGRATDDEFINAVYSVTHLVYTLNNFWTYRLDPRLLPEEYEFLKADLPKAVSARDADMLGEIMDSLKSFGLDDSDPLMREGTEFLLARQHRDGSWGDIDDDVYGRYHTTETAVNGLCRYALRDERLSLPEVKPMLESWAQERDQ